MEHNGIFQTYFSLKACHYPDRGDSICIEKQKKSSLNEVIQKWSHRVTALLDKIIQKWILLKFSIFIAAQ